MTETIGEHDLFQFSGKNNNNQKVKSLKLHSNFDEIQAQATNLVLAALSGT